MTSPTPSEERAKLTLWLRKDAIDEFYLWGDGTEDRAEDAADMLEADDARIAHLAAEITRLRAENARMREALEPFAEEADLWNAFGETVVLVEPFPDLPGSSGLMVHHLRRARAARSPAE